jgi:hypothetical protein
MWAETDEDASEKLIQGAKSGGACCSWQDQPYITLLFEVQMNLTQQSSDSDREPRGRCSRAVCA